MRRDDRRLLSLIGEYQWAFDRGPSISELARIASKARSTVAYQIRRLEARGFIRRVRNKPRRYELIAGPAPRGILASPTPAEMLAELKSAAERMLGDDQ